MIQNPRAGDRLPGPAMWEQLRLLPACIDIPTLAGLLGISRAMAYEYAARDALPVAVIRIGRRLLIPTAQVLALLGASHPDLGAKAIQDRKHREVREQPWSGRC
jgi:hypothetical protein